MRTSSNKRRRSPGWIGTRVTVCGQQIYTQGADLICLLPPKHTPTHIHSSMAMTDDNPPTPIMVIQNDETEELTWLSHNA